MAHELPDPESFWRWFQGRMMDRMAASDAPDKDARDEDLGDLPIEEQRARVAEILAKFPDPIPVGGEGVPPLEAVTTFVSPEAESGEEEPICVLGIEQGGRTVAFRGPICDLSHAFRAISSSLLRAHAEMHEHRAEADPDGRDAQMKRVVDLLKDGPGKGNLN